MFPDHFDHDWRAGSADRVYAAIEALEPGVTEIHVQPAIDTPEVRALGDYTQGWIDDLALITSDTLVERLAERDVTLIGYRDLRDRDARRHRQRVISVRRPAANCSRVRVRRR